MYKLINNFRQLIPCIRVNNVRATMGYYVCELGFKPRYYIKSTPESGGVEINGISIDFISGDRDRSDTSFNFLVDNVDELYSLCQKRSLHVIFDIRNANGMRLFGIKDLNEYRLFFYKWVEKKGAKSPIKNYSQKEIPERFKDSIMKSAVDAVKEGDLEILKKLLSIESSIVFERIEKGPNSNKWFTLLHVLADPVIGRLNERSADIAHTLIKAGCKVDALDRIDKGNTPLQILLSMPGANSFRIEVVKVFMEAGARIDDPFKNDRGMNAFCYAVLNGHTREAKLMFSKVTRPGFVWVAGIGDIKIVQSFFSERGSDEFKDNSRYFLFEETSNNFIPEKNMPTLATAYVLACINGQNEVIELLFKRGVDINVMIPGKNFTGIGATGLHWAAFHGHTETVNLLLKSGANIYAEDDTYSITPAAWAAKGGHHELAYYLTKLGSNY